jgi:PHD/YefM family antitoxin component YafN of YafNO toxin-antitoxin module
VVRELSVQSAAAKLEKLIEDVTTSYVPVIISRDDGNAVLLAERDWTAINETLSLMSVPGMREATAEGMTKSSGDCASDLDW